MAQQNIYDLIKRYEQKLVSGKSVYFDADEFDELAEYYDSQSDIDTARDIVDEGLLIHPESSSLQLKRAKFLVYDGEYANALSVLTQRFSEYDFDLNLLKIECYLQLGLQKDAYYTVKEILENEEEGVDTALSEIGFLYVEADLFEEAVLYLNKSLEYNPENIDVLGDLAYSYEMLGDFDTAIATTNKILDIDSYTYEAWVNIGKLYSLQDQFDKAIDAFDFALTINDHDTSILKLKAHCLSLGNRTEEAIEIFKQLLIDRPADSSIYFLLAECYQLINDTDNAVYYLAAYSEIIDNNMDENDLQQEESNIDTAISIIEQMSINMTDSTDLFLIAGDLRFKQKKIKEAKRYFMQAYGIEGNSVAVLDRLAITAIKEEDYLTAIDYTNRILELLPDNQTAKLRLALLYFETDDEDTFNRIIDEFSNPELRALLELVYSHGELIDVDRMQLIVLLNEARECRILFKNLKY